MDFGRKLAEQCIPALTDEEFCSLSAEGQKEYIRLYSTQVVPKLEVFRKRAPYKLASGGRGSGKSRSFASLLMQELTREPHRLLACREIQRSIQESSYRLFVDCIDRLELDGWQIKADVLENENGSRIIFRGLKDMRASNAIKSLENYDRTFIDEAHTISRESLQILLPTVMRQDGSEMWCCWNPETEDDPIEALKLRAGAVYVRCDWFDNPWFTEQLMQEMKDDYAYNPDEAEHIWGGEFRKQSDNAVMSRVAVREAMSREVDEDGDYQLAVDVARYGDDSSIVTMRKGLKMCGLWEYRQKSLVELCGLVEGHTRNNHDIVIKCDETGVGGGLVDMLQARGYRNVIGINFGSAPQDKDKFSDLPSEMWCTFPLSEVRLMNDDKLFHELTDRRYSYDSKARRKVESKDAYKSRNGGKSPDRADSVLMLFYEPKINRPMLY